MNGGNYPSKGCFPSFLFYLKHLSMKKEKIIGLLLLMLAGIGTTFAQLKTDERERPAFQQTIETYRENLQLNET